ncbi:methyltransferase domain-containing protein [Burkholderia mayonis]|uniref:methyltransferase domain-containing protein n=1 Tax=Burkholderia mayonis TaxID=1385591 RepID=UPI0009E8992B|nr:methyltransferase domain-containing protein [Burkholderia mayonis]
MTDKNLDETQLRELITLITRNGQPNINPLAEITRNDLAIRWNLKVYGYLLARLLLEKEPSHKSISVEESPFPGNWKATELKDFDQSWFRTVCHELHIEPILHRKVWELAYVVSTLHSFDLLRHGVKGLGFACGEEPLPSLFASKGVEVVATDLMPQAAAASGWKDTAQHASSLDLLWKPDLVSRNVFDKHVSLQFVDMNDIPSSLHGQFDFCWSMCAFEHLGSIERGLSFVENSLKVLKPGGIAVHTTEFNFASDSDTIDNWGTVLFRRSDFERLREHLARQGFNVPPVSYETGDHPVDWFLDVPPFPGDPEYLTEKFPQYPHLKLVVDGFPSTCFGLFVQKPL